MQILQWILDRPTKSKKSECTRYMDVAQTPGSGLTFNDLQLFYASSVGYLTQVINSKRPFSPVASFGCNMQ